MNKEKSSDMLEKEFEFFQNNHAEILKLYRNKFVVIKDQKVHFGFDSFEEALETATKQFELGTFIIQLCTEGKEGYTQTFHSRVIFA